MRKQPYPIAQLTGGLDVSVDPVFLMDKSSPNVQNIRFDKGLIKKGLGWATFGTVHADGLPLQGTVMSIDKFRMESGTIYYLMSTVDFTYRYIASSGYYQKLNGNTGSNLVASWVNDNYDTFASTGANITSAVKSTAGTKHADSASITITSAKWYRILATLTLNSGAAPTLTGTGGVTTTVLAAGANTIVFKATAAATVLTMTNAADGNWSCTFTMYLIEEWTGDEDNIFSGVTVLDSTGADLFVVTNGKDDIQKWAGSTTTYMADLLGWKAAAITAKSLTYFQNRLIAGFTTESGTECPKRVRWSIAGNVEDVTGTGSGFVDLVETSDAVVAVKVLKNKLFVIKEESIWELVYVGGTTYFTPVLRMVGFGSYAPKTIESLDEEMFLLGNDDVAAYNGLNKIPIGDQIRPYLYETETRIINSALIHRSPGMYIEELKNYLICCPAAQGTIPNTLFTYDVKSKAWSKRIKEITAFGEYTYTSGTIWSDGVGNWEDQSGAWMSKALAAGAPTTLIGNSSGYVYEDDRLTTSTDYMCYDTKDFIFEHSVRWVEFRMLIKGGAFTVYYSTNGGSTWSTGKSYAAASDWTEFVLGLNVTSQRIRFRVESSATTLDIKWLEPWYIARKRSKSLASA